VRGGQTARGGVITIHLMSFFQSPIMLFKLELDPLFGGPADGIRNRILCRSRGRCRGASSVQVFRSGGVFLHGWS
jgi:hypothetical protein